MSLRGTPGDSQGQGGAVQDPLPIAGDTWVNSIGMKFAYIQAGKFLMGSPPGEGGWFSDEVQHEVKINRGFYLGITEVTQAQWKTVMGRNPSWFKGDCLPVERVSWDDAVRFCRKLSQREARRYRLPTEAEWEYACRAGSTGPYAGTGNLDEMGWHAENSGSKTHPVGVKLPNAWGLYDMHGNVSEWCRDWYGEYPRREVQDPAGPTESVARILRGGSWSYPPRICRSASRSKDERSMRYNDIGFRVALQAP